MITVKKILAGLSMTATASWMAVAAATPTPISDQALLKNQSSAIATAATLPTTLVPPAPTLNAKGYVLMDANSGTIIASSHMDQRMPPASLTKIMTLYITFQALKSGQIHLNDKVRVSNKAWRTGGSRMFLKVGSSVPVQDLIEGVIVASGNDACVTIAQYIGGTEATFAQLMNQTAKQLGMNATHYVDSTGLPNSNHYSTPHDMAILAHAVIKNFPEYYHFFGQKWIKYNNIKQPNRNRLLWRDGSVDGLKTGHTKSAGYCLVSSGKRDNMRLISVMMGTPSDGARATTSQALLNYGFRFYKTYSLFGANKAITKQRIWLGKDKFATFGITQPLFVTIPVGQYQALKASIQLPTRIEAPISKGNSYGQVQVTLNGQTVTHVPLVALDNDPKGGLWTRMTDHIVMFFKSKNKQTS